MSHKGPYLHKAGRTVETLLLGAKCRPLWLQSLQRRKRRTAERHVRKGTNLYTKAIYYHRVNEMSFENVIL